MSHKHAEMIKIWADHPELEVEYFNDLSHQWSKVMNNPSWCANTQYRFAIPNDADGNSIEVGETYTIDGTALELEISTINQVKAEFYLNNGGFDTFYNAKVYHKVNKKPDIFADYPDFEFKKIQQWGDSLQYMDTRNHYLGSALGNPDFVGYGYVINGRLEILNTSITYICDKDTIFNHMLTGAKPTRPDYVVFKKGT